ncbi:hypothetical protein LWI28_012767 [Acer negundo]|uniref:DUF4283 domain-containing protein n=1 Tax=Acer negundo TaxID=4023 RepID=A0AAD5JFQ1_ACENE|nr:hypothetical protein LWI28_012767 [Acer negundo]
MNIDSKMDLGNFYAAKRARAENDSRVNCLRRDVGSFISKLMGMTTPNFWTGFGENKEKLTIESEDISISVGPNGPMMRLSSNLKDKLQKPWTNALILKNMGKAHILNFMLTKLTHKWTLTGKWQLTDLVDGYFVARFQMKDHLYYVLTNGPWVITNQYLAVQR